MSLQSISQDIANNVRTAREAVSTAARQCGRDPASVRVVAVSKTQPAARIREAAAAGCSDFGENYLQEAVAKIDSLADLDVTWHFIGAIQSNKTRLVAERFHWVHTVSRLKIAERLSAQCPLDKILNVTLQVNVDADPGKSGVNPSSVAALLEATQVLPSLRVRGLMTILSTETPPLTGYRRLAGLFGELAPLATGPWDTLSMGMSGDFAEAIGAGATLVRIGTAIFGPRSQAGAAR